MADTTQSNSPETTTPKAPKLYDCMVNISVTLLDTAAGFNAEGPEDANLTPAEKAAESAKRKATYAKVKELLAAKGNVPGICLTVNGEEIAIRLGEAKSGNLWGAAGRNMSLPIKAVKGKKQGAQSVQFSGVTIDDLAL